jgi:hypothetical protein
MSAEERSKLSPALPYREPVPSPSSYLYPHLFCEGLEGITGGIAHRRCGFPTAPTFASLTLTCG